MNMCLFLREEFVSCPFMLFLVTFWFGITVFGPLSLSIGSKGCPFGL
jgi:hypothetical protein